MPARDAHQSSAQYTSPNEILSKTVFVIKTYNRPKCLLALLESLAKFAPWMPVIVADDSDITNEALVSQFTSKLDHAPVFIRLSTDSGGAHGRNRLVEEAHSRGFAYLVMSDDDYVITDQDLIPRLAQALISTGANLVAPQRCEMSASTRWEELETHGFLHCNRGDFAAMIRDDTSGELFILPKVTRPFHDDVPSQHPLVLSSLPARESPGSKLQCRRSDLVQQFFLAETSILRKSNGGGWDDYLKNNDHYDVMLSLQRMGTRLYVCRGIRIGHNKLGCGANPKSEAESNTLERYNSVRAQRWKDVMPYFMRKWNISAVNDEVGRRWFVDAESGKIATLCGIGCSKFPWPKFKALPWPSDKEHAAVFNTVPQDFAEAMRFLTRSLNSKISSWDTLRLDYSLAQKNRSAEEVKVQLLGPCERLYRANVGVGNIQIKWGVESRNNKKTTPQSKGLGLGNYMEYLYLVPRRTCPIFDQLLAMVTPRHLPSHHADSIVATRIQQLYYVTAVSDVKFASLTFILTQLARQQFQTQRLSITFVLVTMTSSDNDSWEKSARTILEKEGLKLIVIKTSPPFSRAIGLRIGFAAVSRLRKSNSDSNLKTVLFSLDTTLRLPRDFSQNVMRGVHCGVSAYAPVCWKTAIASWAEHGYGMIGVCLEDYESLVSKHGGWREKWWYRFGAEDVDMIHQLQSDLIIHRPRVEGYIHTSTQETRLKNPAYYKKKNIWPYDLPVVPISEALAWPNDKNESVANTYAAEDSDLRAQLQAFIRKQLHRPDEKYDDTVWRTPSRPEENVELFSLWTSPEGQLRVVSLPKPGH